VSTAARRTAAKELCGSEPLSPPAAAPLLPTYARLGVTFVEGDGCTLTDSEGKRYLDLVAGIAVVALGHRHPAPLAAAHAQLDRLWHVSNLYSTTPMEELAAALSDRFGGAGAFFCNSGAEAVEAALKWARKATGKTGLVALEGSFHGRTLGALSVTGQPAKREPFAPLVPGVRFATESTLADAVDDDTAAILLEPVQGEGGVRPLAPGTPALARELADAHGAMLVLDEVQTGVGRTGAFFAWEHTGVKPDALTLAKGLANGLPIGALLVSNEAPTAFAPGDHASTFGGNPVACAAACAVVAAVDDELLAHVRAVSEQFQALPGVRGLGLLLAIELDRPAAPVVAAALDRGLLVGAAGDTALRLTPPLTITAAEADAAIEILREVIG
jgi:acetylornithine/N-succinyldiaminopimelate aminotransferase